VISCGKVSDHFPEGHRQKPWPMIAIHAETPGGMSGGPAFDENGRLIGVLCVGGGTGDEAYSLISLIEPALSVLFPSAWVLRNQGTTTLSREYWGGSIPRSKFSGGSSVASCG
jgi:hypothetical protein